MSSARAEYWRHDAQAITAGPVYVLWPCSGANMSTQLTPNYDKEWITYQLLHVRKCLIQTEHFYALWSYTDTSIYIVQSLFIPMEAL